MASRYSVPMSMLLVLSTVSCNGARDAGTANPLVRRALNLIHSSQPPPQTIPLYMSNRRMLVILRVGSSAPVPVVFDTGTSANLVDLGLANSLHLPNTGPSTATDGVTGKSVPGYDTLIQRATLSGVPIADAPATAVAYDQPDEIGIFGPNSFPGKLVRLEAAENRLVILPNSPENVPACASFPYLGAGVDGIPSAILEVGDEKIAAILDTGNDSSIILPEEYSKKLPLESAPKRVGYAFSAAGKQPILSARLKGTMRMGTTILDHPEIHFMKGGKPNIGFPILRTLTLVMDPTGRRDWILPATATQNVCVAPLGANGS